MTANDSSGLSLAGECVICFEPFEENGDNEPHLLSCGHTFCLKCIRDLVREEGGRHVVACPSCRTVSVITAGPPFLPPKNFQLAELIANIRRLSSVQQSQVQPPMGGLPPADYPQGLPPADDSLVPQSSAASPLPPPGYSQPAPSAPPADFSQPAPSAPPADFSQPAPSAPPGEVPFAMYAEPQHMEEQPPPAATAAAESASRNPKQESDVMPVLESEKELELTPAERELFDNYRHADTLFPSDYSLKYPNGFDEGRFMTILERPAAGYPRGRFNFTEFRIGGWEVHDIVFEWINGRWYAPKGFAANCRIPHHFSRVLVPHAVFNVTMTALLTADETYRPTDGGRVKHSQIREQFHCDSRRNYFACSATLLEDRKFYDDAWGKKGWKLNDLHVFDPEADLHLIVPPDQWPEYELMTMKKKVLKEREKKGKGFFGSLVSAIVGVFKDDEEDTNGEHNAPPPDTYMLPGLRASDLWDGVCARCKRELEAKANSRFASLQRQEGYTYKNKRISFVDVSYNSFIVYLPVYSGAYEFTDEEGNRKWYRIAVNAQTGDVEGERPFISVGGVVKSMFGWLGFGKKEEKDNN